MPAQRKTMHRLIHLLTSRNRELFAFETPAWNRLSRSHEPEDWSRCSTEIFSSFTRAVQNKTFAVPTPGILYPESYTTGSFSMSQGIVRCNSWLFFIAIYLWKYLKYLGHGDMHKASAYLGSEIAVQIKT